jgi:hypothetical protein
MATTLRITPTRFIASNGKLDSDFRYIYQVTSGEQFVFPIGKTIDLPIRGIVYELNGVKQVTGTNSSFVSTFLRMRQ